MNMNHFDELEKIKKAIQVHDVVSFDVFDTLLIRPYANPIDLFKHLEKINNCEGFAKIRVNAEKNARKKHRHLEEISLKMIYQEMPDDYGFLQEKELELERLTLKCNPELKIAYEYAASLNRIVVTISDMYLSGDFIQGVLVGNGYNRHHKLYVSSDILKTKHSSSLFRHVLADLKIAPGKMLHIGDNMTSDIQMAESVGITAYYHESAITRLFKINPWMQAFYRQFENECGASIILGLAAQAWLYKGGYWDEIGYCYAGPAILSFALWLDKSFKKHGITSAMFMARDGYTIRKVFECIKTRNILTHYVYAPRILYSTLYLEPESTQTNNNALGEHSATETTPPSIDKTGNERRESFKAYIGNIVSEKQNAALVDTISYRLSIQKLICNCVENVNIYGFYWFVEPSARKYWMPHLKIDFFHTGSESFIPIGDLLEFFMTAPTPPVIDIRNGKPVFKKIDCAEKQRIDVYPHVSDAAIRLALAAKDHFGNIDLHIDCKIITAWINAFTGNLRDVDYKMFSCIKHASDERHEIYVPLINAGSFSTFKKWSYSVFGIIPLLTIEKTCYGTRWLLFGQIPIICIREH